jgi:hypothetical protein
MSVLWRVFPWDAEAPAGSPFSPDAIPIGQGSGRFDIPDLTSVRYFAETPEHAVAEVIQGLRNQSLDAADLIRVYPLALTTATLPTFVAASIVDLCDPQALLRVGVRPDELASTDTTVSQAVARAVFRTKAAGFRWWSALSGDWHTVVLFDAAVPLGALTYGRPEPLTLDASALRIAASRLQITVE